MIMCVCKDHRFCHRTVVADLLRQEGIKVKELGT